MPQTDWTWAALYDGFMAVPDKVAGDKYKQAMLKIAEQLNWQPGPRVMHADDQAVGQMYMEQYFIHKDPKMMDPMRARLDAEMATPDPTDPKKPLWWWCDALFMAPPVYADMATITGDTKYLTFMDHEWDITTALLYDHIEASLLPRRDLPRQAREERRTALLVARQRLGHGRNCARARRSCPPILRCGPNSSRCSKTWPPRCSPSRAKTAFGVPVCSTPIPIRCLKISGSAFITYALAYGVNEGILDRATYWPAVEKAWAGMLTHVYADGRLGCIQPVGAAPGAYTETTSYVYGVGAYLLAGSEIYRTAK